MIVRTAHRRSYSVISNVLLRDARLSFQAKGLAAYLLSMPDGWTIHRDQLAGVGPDGAWAVRSALQELRLAGYLVRHKGTTADGRFRWEVVLHEEPVENAAGAAEEVVVENQPSPRKKGRVKVENQPSPPRKRAIKSIVKVDFPPAGNRTLLSTKEVNTKGDEDTSINPSVVAPDLNSNEAIRMEILVRDLLTHYGVVAENSALKPFLEMARGSGLKRLAAGLQAAAGQGKARNPAYVRACIQNQTGTLRDVQYPDTPSWRRYRYLGTEVA